MIYRWIAQVFSYKQNWLLWLGLYISPIRKGAEPGHPLSLRIGSAAMELFLKGLGEEALQGHTATGSQ